MADNNWHESYVMQKYGSITFFVIIGNGLSVCLLNSPPDVKVGGFFRVKYAPNPNVRDHDRSRHEIIQYEQIEELATVRIFEDHKRSQHAFLRTVARVTGTRTINGRITAALENGIFGHFLDLDGIVETDQGFVDIEFKCRASPIDQTSIFVPNRVFGYIQNTKTISGVIYYDEQARSQYIWTRATRRDVRLDHKYRPTYDNGNSGRWVEGIVDGNDELIAVVKVINDPFQTACYGEDTEVFVHCRYDGFNRAENWAMYNHREFGLIADCDRLLRGDDGRDQFGVWIKRTFFDVCAADWRICRVPSHPPQRSRPRSISPIRQSSSANPRRRSPSSSPERTSTPPPRWDHSDKRPRSRASSPERTSTPPPYRDHLDDRPRSRASSSDGSDFLRRENEWLNRANRPNHDSNRRKQGIGKLGNKYDHLCESDEDEDEDRASSTSASSAISRVGDDEEDCVPGQRRHESDAEYDTAPEEEPNHVLSMKEIREKILHAAKLFEEVFNENVMLEMQRVSAEETLELVTTFKEWKERFKEQ